MASDGNLHPKAKRPVERAGWRVDEWAEAAGIGRSSVYELIAAGTITSVKFGAARIVTTPPRDFLASLSGQAA
jgi:excisionase family DNA binding protein